MSQMGRPNHSGLGSVNRLPMLFIRPVRIFDVMTDEDSSLLTGLDTLLCQSVCVYQPKFSKFDSEFGDVYEWAAAS